jgi:guanylate kinase
MNLQHLGLLLVMSGPSGAGKSTVIAKLRDALPGLQFSVSCTTRPPRPGESDGVDYHFLSSAAFAERVAAGSFIEHADVHAHRYGTLRSEVAPHLEAGRDVLLDIDVQGARQIADRAGQDPLVARCLERVFLAPPSLDELERRLRSRGTDSETSIHHRLANARHEMAAWREYDFLVVNRDLLQAVAALRTVIDALHHRTRRMENADE